MRSLRQSIVTTLLVIGLVSTANAVLPIERLDGFKGAKAYLVQTHSLPMVDIEIGIDAGDRFDPMGKSGLADMTAGLMKYRACNNQGLLTEAQIAEEIADLGANIGLSVSGEREIVRIRTLSRKDLLERAVQLASSMLSSPTYDPNILAREKQRTITGLLEAETKPEYVLERRFKRMVYGSYPLADSPSVKSVSAITADDLRQFHKRFYRGDRMIISIVGDVISCKPMKLCNLCLRIFHSQGHPYLLCQNCSVHQLSHLLSVRCKSHLILNRRTLRWG